MKEEEKLYLYEELSQKGIRLKPQIHNIPHGYQSDIYKDDNNIFHFPLLIIYEEFNMTDYIQDFAENQFIEDIFEVIFENGGLPWDKDNNYNKDNCLIFYQFTFFDPLSKLDNTFYYQMRKDETLIDVLTNKRLHMNGFPIISIVCPKSTNFYQHFMKTKQFIKRKK